MIITRGLGAPQFTNHPSAVAYLRQLALRPENRQQLRHALGGGRPLPAAVSDDEVIRELAWGLVRGEIHVLAAGPAAQATTSGTSSFWSPSAAGSTSSAGVGASTGTAPPAEPPPGPATTGATAPIREQEADSEDASVLPAECDEAAQAESLAAASEAGTPLCEV